MQFKDTLRPVVEDAARSLDYAYGVEVESTMSWFDVASEEDLQHFVMGFVQDGILAALKVERTEDGGRPGEAMTASERIRRARALRDLNEILVEQGVRPTSFAELAELGLELEVIA